MVPYSVSIGIGMLPCESAVCFNDLERAWGLQRAPQG